MKSRTTNLLSLSALSIAVSMAMLAAPGLAQNAPVKTNSRILYHDGPVMQGSSNVYVIWYGNWSGNTATTILTDFVINLGSTSYFNINTLYPDANGDAPNGALYYSASIFDAYSHGASLTVPDIQGIVRDWITAGAFPLDGAGIYLVFGSADITDIRPDGSSFCYPQGSPPHHGVFTFNGAQVKYGFLGNADRCPSSAPQFFAPDGTRLQSPNGNFGADAMASNLAHLLNVIVTSPLGTAGQYGGWYDRYGFENARKCQGIFGPTYQLPNGAPANIRLGYRDFLIQQNWVNVKPRGYCALSYP